MDDMNEVLQRLTAIETELRMFRTNGLPSCAAHNTEIQQIKERQAKLENVVGRHGIVVVAFMAIGTGIGFAFKYLVGGAR